LISQPKRLDTQTMLKELGHVFFTDENSEDRQVVDAFFNQELKDFSLIRSAYFCRPNVQSAKPLFCLVLKSTNASNDLTQIVQKLNAPDLHSICDCHVFSLSDIVAQALEQSKVPL
jgi:hypothetical protein